MCVPKAANTSTPESLAAFYREADTEAFTRHVAGRYEKLAPEIFRVPRGPIEFHLKRAFVDARTLDADATTAGTEAKFLAGFLQSVFFDEGFFQALRERARVPEDQKSLRAIRAAQKSGENERAAGALWLFRERLKDGWPARDALVWHRQEIGECLAEGSVWLLERLAESVRETYSPSPQRWLLRAWLPLALWQDVSTGERERRLRAAGEAETAIGQVLPPFPLPDGREPYPIATLLRTTRATIKRASRRKA